jgi:hypothetical protein
VDGVHGGFGARVGETPAGQAEAAAEFAGHGDGVRGGLGEVGAFCDLRGYGLLDGRVGMAGQGGAVTAVQVDVLVAVDVVDLRAVTVAEPDRLRRGDLPAEGDTAGQVLLGCLGQVRGVRLAADEDLFVRCDDLLEDGVGKRAAGALGPGLGAVLRCGLGAVLRCGLGAVLRCGLGAVLVVRFGGVVVGHHDFKGSQS